jgi:hypothetical protein
MSDQAITDIVKKLEDLAADPITEKYGNVVVPVADLQRVLSDWQSMRSALYGRMEQSSKEPTP